MSIFEKASKKKIRFETRHGLATTEDLWDLPLTGTRPNLNGIAIDLHKKLKDADEVNFVEPVEKDADLQLAFDLVKHIIEKKLAWKEAAEKSAATKAQKQKLMGIIAAKEDQSLQDMDLDDLNKLLEEL